MNTSSTNMSSAPPVKVPPMISTSASIWAPKPYPLSQHHSWPEQVAAWSAMPGHPPSQSQALHERTNMYEQRGSGVPLGPVGKSGGRDALVGDRERRQHVGAIGDGRQNGSGPAPPMKKTFKVLDTLQLIPDPDEPVNVKSLTLDLSGLDLDGINSPIVKNDTPFLPTSRSSPSDSPVTPNDFQYLQAPRVYSPHDWFNSISARDCGDPSKRISHIDDVRSSFHDRALQGAGTPMHSSQLSPMVPAPYGQADHFGPRTAAHEGSRDTLNDGYPSLGLSASRHAPHSASRSVENPRGWPNNFDPAFEVTPPFTTSTSFSRYSHTQLPHLYDAHISSSRYHVPHTSYSNIGQSTSYSSLPPTPVSRTSALPGPYEHLAALQQHLPASTPSSYPSSLASSVSGAMDGYPSSAPTSRSSPQVLEPGPQSANDPINFLQMLQPNANPPYEQFVARIVNNSDQQASVFLQQKLKVANTEDRIKIVDGIVGKGFEMMTHRFGNWAVQRCLESPCSRDDRLKLASVMKGRVVDLATNCYGTHVIQKALDCEEDIKLMILTELLLSDPYATLMNKHSAHVWSRIMELTWTDPAPPIFPCVNIALKGRWVELACHETGSLVVQHAFENLEEADTRDLVDEILLGFDRVVRDSWGSWVVQHLLEHGAEEDKSRALSLLLASLHVFGSDPQAIKSIEKALKCGGLEVLQKFVDRLCEPGYSKRRAMIVDLALNGTGSQLIAQILPMVSKDQGTLLYDAIKKHVVTLKGSKAGSRVTWLFDKMRAYYGY